MLLTLLATMLTSRPRLADVIFRNGNIYTLNPRQPHAQAIAVNGDRIEFVGTDSDVMRLRGPKTKVIDLKGATVVPGLTDAHYHLDGVGERERNFNLEGTNSLSELQDKVAKRIQMSESGAWIVGRGWIETTWKPPVFPTRAELDRVSPHNPVILQRSDGHGLVANSLAFQAAGITKDTPQPAGGQFVKDPATGELTGMVLDNAMGRLFGKLPHETAADLEKAIILGVNRSLKLGWCEVQVPGNSWSESLLMRKMVQEGKIQLRIYDAISHADAHYLMAAGPTIGAYGNHFTVRGIKLYADGSMGSKSAALFEPYQGESTKGFMTLKREVALPVLEEALRKGIQIETHAIGDLANRNILDWYEEALKAVPASQRKIANPRWRVEHAQLVSAEDVPRFAKLGIIPSMQPSHAIGDLHFAERRIGFDRLAEGYQWRNFIKSGSIIPGGSDAPVERGEPMIEFYAAVYRHDLQGFAGKGWHLEQAVSREEALKMFTLWPAYAAFEDGLKGSLDWPMLADMTVLSADIMRIPPAQILKTRCLMTVVGGKVVYDGR